jgi:hypothetical protein
MMNHNRDIVGLGVAAITTIYNLFKKGWAKTTPFRKRCSQNQPFGKRLDQNPTLTANKFRCEVGCD